MNPQHRPRLIHGHVPDPWELYWVTVAPPDGLYVVPPDSAALPEDQSERLTELLLVAAIALATVLLLGLVAIAAVVA